MQVHTLVPHSDVPQGHKIWKGRPAFRIKCNEDGKPVRFKARQVMKGFEQIFGKDYSKTTSSTYHRVPWGAQQIDIKTAYRFRRTWQRGLGLEATARALWHETTSLAWGFTKLACESCVYYHKTATGTVIVAVQVDDFLSVVSSKVKSDRFKEQMEECTISDLGCVRFVVGIAVE